ncbi:hypothetical protein F5Y12DRAFT_730133 [Xylaria sp. FL1777]|nr:hypothetical protein F5Y12DRAFT_730133 [Xylaria sp. FL1777]
MEDYLMRILLSFLPVAAAVPMTTGCKWKRLNSRSLNKQFFLTGVPGALPSDRRHNSSGAMLILSNDYRFLPPVRYTYLRYLQVAQLHLAPAYLL